jgi:hypothetical protein
MAPSVTAGAHRAFPELRADRPQHRPGDDSRPLTHSCPSWRPTGTPQEGGKGSVALVPVSGGRAPIPAIRTPHRRTGQIDPYQTFASIDGFGR